MRISIRETARRPPERISINPIAVDANTTPTSDLSRLSHKATWAGHFKPKIASPKGLPVLLRFFGIEALGRLRRHQNDLIKATSPNVRNKPIDGKRLRPTVKFASHGGTIAPLFKSLDSGEDHGLLGGAITLYLGYFLHGLPSHPERSRS
jgi:hypothetical protein